MKNTLEETIDCVKSMIPGIVSFLLIFIVLIPGSIWLIDKFIKLIFGVI